MPTPRAAFFFGSGISYASKAPDVDRITDSVLNGAWKRHTDSGFYPLQPHEGTVSIGDAQRSQYFLRILKSRLDPLLTESNQRPANYEDLYSAALQMFQHETREITNPLIVSMLLEIKAATAGLYEGQYSHVDNDPVASLIDLAMALIQWAVSFGLMPASKPIGMGVISEVAGSVDELNIFSLNHDLLIETELAGAGYAFTDGFGDQKDGYRIYNGAWLREANPVRRLLKLHGSTNWFRCRFDGTWDQFASFSRDPDHCKDDQGRWINRLDIKPTFLSGTSVKEQAYGYGLFGEIFTEFRDLLSRHRTLICSGYGWGDKGINIRLRQWLHNSPEKRIVVLHNGPIEEIARKNFWFWHWDNYVSAGKVIHVPKWLSECSLSELDPYFDR